MHTYSPNFVVLFVGCPRNLWWYQCAMCTWSWVQLLVPKVCNNPYFHSRRLIYLAEFSGAATTASRLGQPDLALATLNDFVGVRYTYTDSINTGYNIWAMTDRTNGMQFRSYYSCHCRCRYRVCLLALNYIFNHLTFSKDSAAQLWSPVLFPNMQGPVSPLFTLRIKSRPSVVGICSGRRSFLAKNFSFVSVLQFLPETPYQENLILYVSPRHMVFSFIWSSAGYYCAHRFCTGVRDGRGGYSAETGSQSWRWCVFYRRRKKQRTPRVYRCCLGAKTCKSANINTSPSLNDNRFSLTLYRVV